MARKGLPKSIIKKYGISKKAWRVFRGRKKSKSSVSRRKTTRRKTKSNPKGGRKTSKSLYRSVVKLAKGVALLAPAVAEAVQPTSTLNKVSGIAVKYTGYDIVQRKWKLGKLVEGWGPYVGVSVGEKIVSKVNSIIRGL